MIRPALRVLALVAALSPMAPIAYAAGTDAAPAAAAAPTDAPEVAPLDSYAAPHAKLPLALPQTGEVSLTAELTDKGAAIPRGVVWRVFSIDPNEDGKLPMIATGDGGTALFHLRPGPYLVHAAFGRAGATKRIRVGREPTHENVVLDAGGIELNATLRGGGEIPPQKLRFSIYEPSPDGSNDGELIIPNVRPDAIVRLNAGVYHIVSKYGRVNAVVRADLRVEAGKLTQATVEHRAAQVTIKLVRDHGGEAIADTSWQIVSDAGDLVRKTVGPFAAMVLAEGEYTAIAKNRGQTYQRAFTVKTGQNEDVEVLSSDTGAPAGVGKITD